MARMSTSRIKELQKDYEELANVFGNNYFDTPEDAIEYFRNEGVQDIELVSSSDDGETFSFEYDGGEWSCEAFETTDDGTIYDLCESVELTDDQMRCPFYWNVFDVDCDD